jgi:8-oxo-dGTP diphosphatase
MKFIPQKNPILVTCALLFQDGKVLAARRSQQMDLPLLWEFPGGKVEVGESEKNCLTREIQEELGIGIEVFDRLGNFDCAYSDEKLIRLTPFLAMKKSGEINLLEHSQIIWLARFELQQLEWAPADLPIVEYLERNWEECQKKMLNYLLNN